MGKCGDSYDSPHLTINIRPNENRCVAYLALGEGYHNYHHTFPYDYSASEYGWKDAFNPATAFIDLCAKYGLAYDLRKPSEDMIDSRMKRTGNGGQRLTSIHNGLNYFFGVMSASWIMVVYLLVKLF
ncbi:unnamed protein product [Oppiella nova]|uniref:Uncharacterized protein n=1 Tax=Oppiella nova TaxID=334625 RepID=A0A7R9M8Z6_9ACAR|nr:unnamed protein product [Oppiella nova]CAG2172716.1 unnamed protein product [Oppiella nova]